ncbi:hypothetical protein U9M48_018117 [Paspalum notatum var. saurae]|uniref:Uncharacterized protein n=1 Tax=Paspalum notatum var. saurae TaxID=547442 RepID=A0AAQ3WPT5_PASNO
MTDERQQSSSYHPHGSTAAVHPANLLRTSSPFNVRVCLTRKLHGMASLTARPPAAETDHSSQPGIWRCVVARLACVSCPPFTAERADRSTARPVLLAGRPGPGPPVQTPKQLSRGAMSPCRAGPALPSSGTRASAWIADSP